MGLLDFFRRRSNEERDHQPQKGKLSEQEAEIMCREFGRYLAEELPVIKDIKLLPYPKDRIIEALNISIQRARDQTDLDSPQLLNALESCRHGLSLFTKIDPEDREAVAYFNQFQSAKVVPEQRKSECLQLIMKYLKRTTSDSSGTLDKEIV